MAQLKRIGQQLQIFAPAKINLFLHILGRRADGFHELETLMVPISLGDELLMETVPGSAISLFCAEQTLTTGAENLITRAAVLFQETYDWRAGLRIALTKRIPIGAGLGGGSSNAAATLLGLRELSGLAISNEELARLAGLLGSDTSFFIECRPALCRGRGEIMTPLSLTQSYTGLLINPGFEVSTPWAYQAFAEKPGRGVGGKSFPFGALRNDLEVAVLPKYLWIAAAKNWLQGQVEVQDALMSGSGSSLFAILRENVEASLLAARFRAFFGETILACPIRINSCPD